ncbi:MAG TPA: hypothetical protein VJ396_06130 [Acidiferrobacterales bacterium]|nr:hypothetical protein [Acidiferrobacterales bacterium]
MISHTNPAVDAQLRERHSAIEPRVSTQPAPRPRAQETSIWPLVIGPGILLLPLAFAFQLPRLESMHQLMTMGAFIILAGALVAPYNWIHGIVAGEKAPANPWGSNSLEWTTASPPPGNFPAAPVLRRRGVLTAMRTAAAFARLK